MNIRYLVGAVALAIAIPVGYSSAQDQEERQITLVGCVMREVDYRDMYGPGLSGPRGAGIGGRNEYMLVDARETTPGASIPAESTACPPAPGTFPTAYEVTGRREGELRGFLGQRVEVSGIQKEANARPVGTSGIPRPTGGFDPLGHELHLFEVEIESVRAAAFAAAPAAAAPAERAEAPAPAVEAAPAAPEPEVVAEAPAPAAEVAAPAPEPEREAVAAPEPEAEEAPRVAQTELPRTASPLPLAGLLGLLSLAAAASVRSLRRRQ